MDTEQGKEANGQERIEIKRCIFGCGYRGTQEEIRNHTVTCTRGREMVLQLISIRRREIEQDSELQEEPVRVSEAKRFLSELPYAPVNNVHGDIVDRPGRTQSGNQTAGT